MAKTPNLELTITFIDGDTINFVCYGMTFIGNVLQVALSPIANEETGELEHPKLMKYFVFSNIKEISQKSLKKGDIN